MPKNKKEPSLKTEVTVLNNHGLHMRFAGSLVAVTSSFNADIFLSKGRHTVNAKSILDIVSLSAAQGAKLTLLASGDDASDALAATSTFFSEYTGDK